MFFSKRRFMSIFNTFISKTEIAKKLDVNKKIFFLGIGGIGMSGIALLMHKMGYTVCGYDKYRASACERLESEGIKIIYAYPDEFICDFSVLVYTLAIDDRDALLLNARKNNILCISRADMLGYLSSLYSERICVCGMHGKSTATAMLDCIFAFAGMDFTSIIGALPSDTGKSFRCAQTNTCILMEACEYKHSFLTIKPTYALVLNIELEHTDCYKTLAEAEDAFKTLLTAGECKCAVINSDAVNTAHVLPRKEYITYSFSDSKADFYAYNLITDSGGSSFDVAIKGEYKGNCVIKLLGEHNASNALGVMALAYTYGVDFDTIIRALSGFNGIKRRLEKIGNLMGAGIFLDYAHHPSEIYASLCALKKSCTGRLICVFQPHTYSRTASFCTEIADALSVADSVILLPIYAAREENVWGISSADIQGKAVSKTFVTAEDFSEAAEFICKDTVENDCIVLMGAGDIDKIFDFLKE